MGWREQEDDRADGGVGQGVGLSRSESEHENGIVEEIVARPA